MNDNIACSVGDVSGIPVYLGDHNTVLNYMEEHINSKNKASYISITNTESMYHALRIPEHRSYIDGAAFSLCDGIGVVIAGRSQGKVIPRFNGPVLLLKACEYGQTRGWRHFFCGGKEGVADLLADKLRIKFDNLSIAGTYCPPFRPMTEAEEDLMIAKINDARPDILWVGLGLLKQERWIAKFRAKLDVPWLIGVGAAFDYHAGTARWAPLWIQKIGLEWAYRLCFEPRMWVRNGYSFIFLLEAIKDAAVMRLIGRTGTTRLR